ncbi:MULTISPECIES: DUF6527 family protein [Acidobacterium]|uniref:DUF6527 family protein n=1 Tax=Acidobacterium TaxID=33973 RepID=UPI0005A063A0|nr:MULTISPECIES: DUF6527 family protein [Acidobacterium]
MKATHFAPQFVESIPEILKPGELYVSMSLASVIHLCACGCGQEVVTPLSPTDWKLCFDGENVTLDPSIGNWNFECRSHYWIRGGKVRWSGSWSREEIAEGRAYDRGRKSDYYNDRLEEPTVSLPEPVDTIPSEPESNPARRSRLAKVWSRLTAWGNILGL